MTRTHRIIGIIVALRAGFTDPDLERSHDPATGTIRAELDRPGSPEQPNALEGLAREAESLLESFTTARTPDGGIEALAQSASKASPAARSAAMAAFKVRSEALRAELNDSLRSENPKAVLSRAGIQVSDRLINAGLRVAVAELDQDRTGAADAVGEINETLGIAGGRALIALAVKHERRRREFERLQEELTAIETVLQDGGRSQELQRAFKVGAQQREASKVLAEDRQRRDAEADRRRQLAEAERAARSASGNNIVSSLTDAHGG